MGDRVQIILSVFLYLWVGKHDKSPTYFGLPLFLHSSQSLAETPLLPRLELGKLFGFGIWQPKSEVCQTAKCTYSDLLDNQAQ